MSDKIAITILGEEISVTHESMPIETLKYLTSNPRVHSALHGHGHKLPDDAEEQQNLIHDQLFLEPSVKNLIPLIRNAGGLSEPIFVRYDTKEVIEGNSRLRAYHFLSIDEKDNEKWTEIPCQIVSSLTNMQQYSYLNQIHVQGKTPWLAYEKANLAYSIKVTEGSSVQEIANTLSISTAEVRKRLETIDLMRENDDDELSNFSYYNVLIRNRRIACEIKSNLPLKKMVLAKIRTDDQSAEFTAQNMRDKLPSIIAKKKELKKFVKGKLSLDGAYQNARISGPHQNVKVAIEKIQNIEMKDLECLVTSEINAFLIAVKKLNKAITRVKLMAENAAENKIK